MAPRPEFETLDRWFDRLLDCAPSERDRLLAELRRDEPSLAETLNTLLADAESSATFLETEAEATRDRLLAHAFAENGFRPASNVDRSGDTLGAYRLEAVIGRGDKAIVYRARRVDGGWEDQVAVKVLARGVNTDDVLRRFLAERQILTVLRHSNIATLLDGGVTEDALPYFVMEYIDGAPIDAWCRDRASSLAERLRLFRDAATAVAFAHRRLIVHRDIKPSNILVNADGQVKLLDFGIAKWLDSEALPGAAARTEHMVRPMTPAYAAPEQQRGDGITTATDVYQLGLLLTTLLCGVEQPRRALDIDEGGTPHRRPSRVAGPVRLPYALKDLRGDLDWIILKALSPAPEERYGSASEMLADLDDSLAHRPIHARAPSALYTLRKFVRRRPVVATVTGFALVALMAGLLVVTHFNRQLAHEKRAALDALDRAHETRNLLVRLITEADPFNGTGADARIRDALANANAAIEVELAGRPALQAELYGVLGDAWWSLSEAEPARDALEKQYRLLATFPDVEPFRLLVAERKLLLASGTDDNVETQLAALRALGQRLEQEYPDQRVERATVAMETGRLLRRYGQPEQALAPFEAAVALLDTEPSPDPHQQAFALVELGDTVDDLQRHDESLALIQRALAIRVAVLGEDHTWTLTNRLQLAAQLTEMDRLDEALAIYEALVPVYETRLGRLHDQTLSVMNNHGLTYMGAGRYEAAAEIFVEVLERKRERGGEPTLSMADSLQNLGALMVRLERLPEAVEHLEAADALYRRFLSPGNPLLAYPHLTLAAIYAGADDAEALEFHARQAEEFLTGNVPETHPAWLKSQCLVGDALLRRGERVEGERRIRAGLDGLAKFPGDMDRHIAECRSALIRAEIETGTNAP